MSKRHLVSFSATLIFALLVSATSPFIVYADDGTQPEPDTTTTETSEVETEDESTDDVVDDQLEGKTASEPEVDPLESSNTDEDTNGENFEESEAGSAEETSAEEKLVVDASAGETPADEVPAEETPVEEVLVDESPVTEGEESLPETSETPEPISEASVPEESVIEQVPENTQIVVINAKGEEEPLATQEAADAVATTSDPIWCPASQAPSPGANGCTDSFGSFDELLTFLKDNEDDAAYQQAGIIYIEMGGYSGGESTIDFNTYGFTSLNNYDLTVEGGWDTSDNTVNAAAGTSLNASLTIGSEANPWVGSLSFSNLQIQDLVDESALTAYSQNNITLTNVEITNIQNDAAATLVSEEGNVTITESHFNDSGTGAVIKAGGNINIAESTFNNNNKGLETESSGYISLYGVEANNNREFGANINAASASISNSFFSGNKAYVGSKCGGGQYYGYGLQVVALDSISLTQVTANDNNLYGASLDSASGVFISNSTFSNNGSVSTKSIDGKGLEIKSGGYVLLADVEASNNREFGANIEAANSVSVSNSFFSGNKAFVGSYCGCGTYYGYGLQVVSLGSVNLSQVTANDNNLFGTSLDAASDVTINNSTFSNNGSDATKSIDGKGLEIKSGGYVFLADVEANNNREFGANINAASSVSVNSSFFSGNKAFIGSNCGCGTYYGYGLQVVSLDSIFLDQVTANENNLFGASLDAASMMFINNSTFSNNGSVSTKSIDGKGLEVKSGSYVFLYGVEANNNREFGAHIEAASSVSVNNSFFSGNKAFIGSNCGCGTYYGYGLQVVSLGSVNLNQVTANDNNLFGAHLETEIGADVLDSVFDNNGTYNKKNVSGNGLKIESNGIATIENTQANGNYVNGTVVEAVGNVKVTNSTFNDNQKGTGLSVTTSSGEITLDSVTAANNGQDGAYVKTNCANVYVIDGSYSNNGRYGLTVIDSTLNLSGSPEFSNNGSGSIFEDSSCFSNGGTDDTIDDTIDDDNKKHGKHDHKHGKHKHGRKTGYKHRGSHGHRR